MSEINGNDNLSKQDLDDLALLGVNETEDTVELQLFKGQNALRWVVVGASGVCSSAVVKAIIDNNVTPKNRFGKIQLFIGAAAIGAVVSATVQTHVSESYDSLIETIRDLITEEV